MIKNITGLEHQIGNRIYQFTCGITAPISEIKEVLCTFMGHIAQVEANHNAQVEANNKEQMAQKVQGEPPTCDMQEQFENICQ